MKTIRMLSRKLCDFSSYLRCNGYKVTEGVTAGMPNVSVYYVMPYSFVCNIRNIEYFTLWPGEGAIVSPVQIITKKRAVTRYTEIIDFLSSDKLTEIVGQQYCALVNSNTVKSMPKGTSNGLGGAFSSETTFWHSTTKFRTCPLINI